MIKETHDFETAVQDMKAEIAMLLETENHVVMALPGGNSIIGLFEAMAKADLPWDKIHLFVVDERLVPADSKESNFQRIKELLVSKIDVPEENVHPFVMGEAPDFGSVAYTEKLRSLGGFDVVVLGVGEDSHVAGLFPGYTIKEDKEGYFPFFDSPKPPKDRVTASKSTILEASYVIGLFIGDSKKKAYESFKEQGTPVEKCPAKLINFFDKGIIIQR